MKKILQTNDRLLSGVRHRRFRRGQYSNKKRRYRRSNLSFVSSRYFRVVKSPFVLNVWSKNNRRHTLAFFEKVRKAIIDDNVPTRIDLTNLQYLNPGGTILLIAELDRAKRIMGDDFRVSLIPSRVPRINAVLKQIGVAGLCGSDLGGESTADDHELVRHWRYATGARINEQTTKAFENFEGRLAANHREGMWRSISEALGNITEHAYLRPRGTDSKRMGAKRWWMFSQELDDRLTVVVADLGIGIPRSLPLKWPVSTLGRIYDGIVGQGEDVRAIKAAMRLGETSTGKRHRGRGLPQIWNELRDTPGARVTIFSNRGILHWDDRDRGEEARELAGSIFGTVIVWNVPIVEASG